MKRFDGNLTSAQVHAAMWASGVLSGTPGDNLLSPYIFTAQVLDALGTTGTRVFSLDVANRYRTCGSCH